MYCSYRSFEADSKERHGHHSTLVLKVPKVNLLTSQPAVRNRFTQSLKFFFSNILAFFIIASNPSLPRPIEGRICSVNSPISVFLLFSLDIFGPTDDTCIASDIVLNSWRSFLTKKDARNTSNWVALTCKRIWGENMMGTPPTDLKTDDDCCHPSSKWRGKMKQVEETYERGHIHGVWISTQCRASKKCTRTSFFRVHPRSRHPGTKSYDELIGRLSAF